VVFELLELLQALVEVHPEMGNDVAHVIGVPGIVLDDDAHDPADELDIWRKGSERAEYRRDAEFRVVEAFPEHLNLHDAIERAVSEIGQDFLLLFVWLLAVYNL